MVTIKDGYNGEKTEVIVTHQDGRDTIGLWIELGIPRILGAKGKTRIDTLKNLKDGETYEPSTETLSYMTITEAIALRNELNQAIKEAAGL